MNTNECIKLSILYPRLAILTLATLAVINEKESCTVNELSKCLGISTNTVATIINRLNRGKAGNLETELIYFSPIPGERSRLICLTCEAHKSLFKVNIKELVNLAKRLPKFTVRSLAILMVINDHKGCSVTEIGKFMGVNVGTVRETIRRMVRDSRIQKATDRLIKIKLDSQNNNLQKIYLTNKTQRILNEL